MRHLGVTWDDLRHNRAGRLGERQQARLQRARWTAVGWLIAIYGTMPLLAAPLLEQAVGAAAGARSLASVSLPVNLLLFSLPFIALRVMNHRLQQLAQDLREGRVEAAEGCIALDSEQPLRRVYRAAVTIRQIPLALHPRVARHFDPEQAYRVYYAPRSRILLGAEPLSFG
jgi:hypothetical protein